MRRLDPPTRLHTGDPRQAAAMSAAAYPDAAPYSHTRSSNLLQTHASHSHQHSHHHSHAHAHPHAHHHPDAHPPHHPHRHPSHAPTHSHLGASPPPMFRSASEQHRHHRHTTTTVCEPGPKGVSRTNSTSSWDGSHVQAVAQARPCGGTVMGSNVKGPCKPIGRTDGHIICWWCSRWLGTFEIWTPPTPPPHSVNVYDSDEDWEDRFYA